MASSNELSRTYTIFDEDIWKRVIEKYDLKKVAVELDVYDNPQKANEMLKVFEHNFGLGKLSEKESEFRTSLLSVKFVEEDFLDMLVVTGREHFSVGDTGYMQASIDLALVDFESSFKDFVYECGKRGVEIEEISFKEAYEIFLYVIKLKLKYQVPYTKLFIRRLLELSSSCYRKEDLLEIKNYFLEYNPKLLPEIESELVE